jgi:hypothetical protein
MIAPWPPVLFPQLVVPSTCCLHRGINICTFTAMAIKTFNKSVPYKDFELMNEATVYKVKSRSQANNKRSRGNSEDLKSDDSYDDDEPPPPNKKQKSGFKFVITTSHEKSNNDN